METPLVLALMAASLYAYAKDRPVLLGVLAALLLLARIDTLIWIGVVGGLYFLRHCRDEPRALAWAACAFGVVAAPWHIYAYWTFHSLIPQSLVGKAVSHEAFSGVDAGYFRSFYHIYFPVGRLGDYWWVGVALTLALLLFGVYRLWRGHPQLLPLGLYFFGFAASFLLGRAPLYMWYFPPSQWIALLLVGISVYWLWNRTAAFSSRPVFALAPWAAAVLVLVGYSAVRDFESWNDLARQNQKWLRLAEFIDTHSAREDRVFLEHIGLVGYKSGRPILDNMGLVSPEIITLKRKYPGQWIGAALREFAPEVAVLYPHQDPRHDDSQWTAAQRKWFEENYRLATEINTQPSSSVYLRADKAAPTDLREVAFESRHSGGVK